MRILAALAAAVLLALPLAAQQPAKPPAKKPAAEKRERQAPLAAAQQAIEEKRYDTAILLLENFLLENPGHGEALFNLAYVYSLAGRNSDAIDTYRQTLEVEPKLFPARFNLGMLLAKEEKTAEAAEEFLRAAELEPENYRAHLFAAAALEESGRKDEALAHYRRAAELEPKNPEPRRALLTLLLEKDDVAGAEELLAELLQLEPAAPDLLRLRAELLLRREQDEEALAAFEDYLQVKPDDSSAHLALGRLYRSRGKPEEALRHFQAADASGNPAAAPSAEALQERAELLAELNRWPEAVPLYEAAAAREPENADVRAGLGFAYLETKQYVRAAEELQAALRLDPRRVKTYDHLASALYLGGNLSGAIEALDRRAAVAEETPGTLYVRAISYDKLRQCEPAIVFYEKFLALNQDKNSDAYFQSTARLRLLKKSCKPRRRE
ncbi:MAG: tetratricopeptide repeat protein [Candidatus Acidiferrales bacterium]